MSTSKDKLSSAQWILERTLGWIAAAEIKVGAITAIDVAMLTALGAFFSVEPSKSPWAILLGASAAGALLIALFCTAMVLFPRLKGGPKESLIFFSAITGMSRADYVMKFESVSEQDILKGPVQLLVADLRTERSHEQVLGPDTWSALKVWLKQIPENGRKHPGVGCQHLLFMSSVPVVHPKLTLAEAFLDNFGSDHVLDSSADDLKDHWTHDDHEGERLRLLETLFATAKAKAAQGGNRLGGCACGGTWGRLSQRRRPSGQLGADPAVHVNGRGSPISGICG